MARREYVMTHTIVGAALTHVFLNLAVWHGASGYEESFLFVRNLIMSRNAFPTSSTACRNSQALWQISWT